MKLITLLRDNGRGNRKEYRTVLRAIWRRGSPHTVLGKILPTLLLFGPMLSLSQFFISEEKSCEAEQSATRLMDYYICFFAALLTVMLWLMRQSPPMGWLWLGLWWFIPAWRIVDVVTYRLYFVFLK